MVCKEDWEPRHIADFYTTPNDTHQLPWVRSDRSSAIITAQTWTPDYFFWTPDPAFTVSATYTVNPVGEYAGDINYNTIITFDIVFQLATNSTVVQSFTQGDQITLPTTTVGNRMAGDLVTYGYVTQTYGSYASRAGNVVSTPLDTFIIDPNQAGSCVLYLNPNTFGFSIDKAFGSPAFYVKYSGTYRTEVA
jgi:hypothetical protein